MAVRAKQLLLVVDVGNTSATLGLCRGGCVVRTGRVPSACRDAARIGRAVRTFLRGVAVEGAMYASVVPAADRPWRAALKKSGISRALQLNHRLELGVRLDYPHPETLGADRLANLAAATAFHPAPAIVMDFGTAATFDVILPRRGFIGGIIAPGPALMLDYLADRTALLPRLASAPVRAPVGRNTAEAMRLGATWGYRGLVREIVAELQRRFRLRRVTLIATGGHARAAVAGLGLPVRIEPDFTLRGLARIHALNNPV